jgi:hypothetical protein
VTLAREALCEAVFADAQLEGAALTTEVAVAEAVGRATAVVR